MTPFNERDTENLAVNLKINFPIQESFGPTTKYQRELIQASADRLLAQHEEIERLRIQLEFTDKIKLRLPPDLNDLVNDTLERAAQVCDARQNYEPECPETAAYCADAIRSLKSGEPK